MQHVGGRSGAALHAEGYATLGQVPDWNLCRLVEDAYDRYHEVVQRAVVEAFPQWECHRGQEDPKLWWDCRAGALVAEAAQRQLGEQGLSAVLDVTEAPESIDAQGVVSGPRFLCSLRFWEARLQGRGPSIDDPPEELRRLLWPELGAEGPRLHPSWTLHIGWTLVPPLADPQRPHCDIPPWPEHTKVQDRCEAPLGRFHNLTWKRDRGAATTEIAPGRFVSARQAGPADIAALRSPAATALVFDKEMLHRGGPNPQAEWSTSMYCSFCSPLGWQLLGSTAYADDEALPVGGLLLDSGEWGDPDAPWPP